MKYGSIVSLFKLSYNYHLLICVNEIAFEMMSAKLRSLLVAVGNSMSSIPC